MKVCACFLLFAIFALTNSTPQNNQPDNARSVNLVLESVLEFNKKDKSADIKFLDEVNEFISKVKTAILTNKNVRHDIKKNRVDINKQDYSNNIVKQGRHHHEHKKSKHKRYNIKYRSKDVTPKPAKFDDQKVMKNRRKFNEFNPNEAVTDTIRFSLEYQPWFGEDIDNNQTAKTKNLATSGILFKDFEARIDINNENAYKSHKNKHVLKRAENVNNYDTVQDIPAYTEDEVFKLSVKPDTDRSMTKQGKVKLQKQQSDMTTMGMYEYKKLFESVSSDMMHNATFTITSVPYRSIQTPSLRVHQQLRPDPLILPRIKATLDPPTLNEKNPSSPTASSSRWFVTAIHDEPHGPSKQISKTNQKKESIEHLIESDKAISIQLPKKDDTTSRPRKVKNVLRRINELEKELTDAKNQLIGIKLSKLKAKKRTVKTNLLNGDIPKRKSFTNRSNNSNHKGAEKTKFVYKYIKENVIKNTTGKEDMKQAETTQNDRTTLATQTNFIFRVNSGSKVTKGIKLMIEDQDYVNPEDPRLRIDYEGVDEWKALKFARIESKTSSTTLRSTFKPSTTKSTTVSPLSVTVAASSKSLKAVQRASDTPTVRAQTNKRNTTSQLTADVSKSSTPTTKVISTRSGKVSTVNIVKVVNSTKLENVTSSVDIK